MHWNQLWIGIVASLIANASAGSAGFTFGLLSDLRSNISVIPYSPDQRVLVAQQAQNLFSVCFST